MLLEIENLGKQYRITREPILGSTAMRNPFGLAKRVAKKLIRSPQAEQADSFWALRECNFKVAMGEAVGVIGHNGAGKSTLLKLISQVTAPTVGRIKIRGRVSSLLEAGTGFHPELTGRENIFMNGAILGMARSEISRCLDSIVEFSGIGQFLDTPLKRYSTGMHVKLGFAIAAHVDSEIMIVDEVLAVGDIQFQRKSVASMRDRLRSRAILFVSHNIGLMRTLCSRSILLERGRVIGDGPTSEIVDLYLKANSVVKCSRALQSNGEPTVLSAEMVEKANRDCNLVDFEVCLESKLDLKVGVSIRIFDDQGVQFGFASLGEFDSNERVQLSSGRQTLRVSLDVSALANGNYTISIDLSDPGIHYYDRAENVASFEVARHPASQGIRVMQQSWRVGSCEIKMSLV